MENEFILGLSVQSGWALAWATAAEFIFPTFVIMGICVAVPIATVAVGVRLSHHIKK